MTLLLNDPFTKHRNAATPINMTSRPKWTATNRYALVFIGCFLFLGLGVASAHSQTSDTTNCSDAGSSLTTQCRSSNDTSRQPTSTSSQSNLPTDDVTAGTQTRQGTQQVYVDTAGATDPTNRRRNNPNTNGTANGLPAPPPPPTDFQRLIRSSTGELLNIFGSDLFQSPPTTFAPADQIPVTSDYVVGPGDQLLVRLWGPDSFNSQLTVDTTGSIYIPKVGAIHVAGLRFEELQKQINTDISRIYRNFNLSVNMGQLRSIQVYIVGEARHPGAYTISALSTVFNALLVSGGPTAQGSYRNIQVRRGNEKPKQFDLYDILLRGDKSNDLRLEPGDTIFIPVAGPQVAVAGSVRHPAIYELRGKTSIADLLHEAGGNTQTAASDHISLERIDTDHTRKALTISLATDERNLNLRDGDVIFVNHIRAAYEKSVTIRGNLANPGRFPWHPGMRLDEIIPDRMSLLTNDYWQERNRLGVPVPLFQPIPQNNRLPPNSRSNSNFRPGTNTTNDMAAALDEADQNAQTMRANVNALALQRSQLPLSETTLTNETQDLPTTSANVPDTGLSFNDDKRLASLQRKVAIPVAEIDWSYAVIERLDPQTLKTSLLPFNLGKLVQDHDTSQNLELQPGDVVTILSQADISVSQNEQTKFVRLEGEFLSAGIYSVHPGETLDQLVQRAGGLTNNAYLYGSSFLRESARVFQQQRLDEYISTLSADMERASAVRTVSSTSGITDPNALAQQRDLIRNLRQLKATGRIVLEFQPSNTNVGSIPKIPLENGDVFRIPTRPSTVSVVGAVYGQNVFLYNPNRNVEDYLKLAGKPNRIADKNHAFIIRADGSIYSRESAKGTWSNHFYYTRLNPGDSIVIPEKPIKPTVLRELMDYSQIFSSFGIAAAAITVLH